MVFDFKAVKILKIIRCNSSNEKLISREKQEVSLVQLEYLQALSYL